MKKIWLCIRHVPKSRWIKSGIVSLFVIAIAIIIISCHKKYYVYYAYCETGHTSWKGTEYSTKDGSADTKKLAANMEANDHDTNIHAGIKTASVRSDYK